LNQRVSQIEEIELCKKAQSGDKRSLNTMVTHNIGLVQKIAGKFYIKNEQYDSVDLIQEGVFGLIKAINKFDAKQGCRFSTYAYYWIYSYVSRYHTNMSGKIRIPSHIRQKISSCVGEIEKDEIRSTIPITISLSQKTSVDTEIGDMVSDDSNDEMMLEYNVVLSKMKDVLTEREMKVIQMRYGIEGQEKLTHRDCAKYFNVTYGTIFNVERSAIQKLQEVFS